MKISLFTLFTVMLIVTAIAVTGCSSVKQQAPTTTGTSGAPASSGGDASPAAVSSGTCPATTSATSWSGNWVGWSNSDICDDGRVYFYPPNADNPDPWDSTHAGVEDFPVKFTQTGCDITGSIVVGPNGTMVAQPGCPITLTGKVDSTGAASGTWHAYCNIQATGTSSSDGTTDSGSWSLNMEPGGSTFIGTFGPSAADTAKYKADSCPNANSNWVGKRA